MATERVTCFRESHLKSMFGTREWIPASHVDLDDVCIRLNTIENEGGTLVMDRPDADKADGYRHIGTYALININGFIAMYRRGSSGGEGRLHGRLSIGFGGHYTTEDEPPDYVISRKYATQAATREVDEEVSLDAVIGWKYVGMIRSSESPVDRVHIGLCFECTLTRPDGDFRKSVAAREDCIKEIAFAKPEQIDKSECETWTKILLSNMRERPVTTYF